jgi:hypothetical protein
MVTYGRPQAAISAVDEQLSDGMAARTSSVVQEHNDVFFPPRIGHNFLGWVAGGGKPKIQMAFLTRH